MKDLENLRNAIDELLIKSSLISKELHELRRNLLDMQEYIDSL